LSEEERKRDSWRRRGRQIAGGKELRRRGRELRRSGREIA
jgi:hypothetical protein